MSAQTAIGLLNNGTASINTAAITSGQIRGVISLPTNAAPPLYLAIPPIIPGTTDGKSLTLNGDSTALVWVTKANA